MTAVVAASDGITREAASHATDHGACNAMGCQAANQRATTCAQRGPGVMGMAAASVSESCGGAGAKNDQTGRGDFTNTFHLVLLKPFEEHKERT